MVWNTDVRSSETLDMPTAPVSARNGLNDIVGEKI